MAGLFKKKQKTDLQKLIGFVIKYHQKKRKAKRQMEREAKKYQRLQKKAEWAAAHPSALTVLIADIKNKIYILKTLIGCVLFLTKVIAVIKAIVVIIFAIVQALKKKSDEKKIKKDYISKQSYTSEEEIDDSDMSCENKKEEEKDEEKAN